MIKTEMVQYGNQSRLYYGDAQKILPSLNDSISVVITSPPYKNSDGYSDELIKNTFDYVRLLLKDDGLLFLNFGHLAEDKSRPFKVLDILLGLGYKLNDTITWVKSQYSPGRSDYHLENLTEFIFLLYKRNMPKLDRMAIGIPYQDKSNIGRYSSIDMKPGQNVWYIKYDTIQNKSQKLHPHRFPIELPLRCIKLSNPSLVLDPFAGSGSTGLACKQYGCDFIGIEQNRKYFDIANKLLR